MDVNSWVLKFMELENGKLGRIFRPIRELQNVGESAK